MQRGENTPQKCFVLKLACAVQPCGTFKVFKNETSTSFAENEKLGAKNVSKWSCFFGLNEYKCVFLNMIFLSLTSRKGV